MATNPKTRLSSKAVIVFFLSLALCSALLLVSIKNQSDLDKLSAERIMTERAQNVTEVLTRLIYKTQTLAALVIQRNGQLADFDRVAATIIDDPAIMNLLVAPNGVVSDVYPLAENETVIGLDLLGEGAGNREAIMAKEQGQLVFGGPFTSVQGRQALVGRLPVYLPTADGGKRFWGLVSVTIYHPGAFAGTTLSSLKDFGYNYELWRINPDDGQRQVIIQSGEAPSSADRFIEIPVNIYGADWHLRISPVNEWYEHPGNWGLIFGGLLVSFLIAFLTQQNLALREMQSALERQQETLRRTAVAAEEASRLKSAFLANMSHEIRTPMNGIIGFAELAIDDERVPGKTRRFLGNIKASAEGLLRILNDILDLSKIESGRVELEAAPFRLGDILDQCETIIAPLAIEKGLELHFSPRPPLTGYLSGDPDKLRRVFLNLLSNAVKFTPNGAVKFISTLENVDEETATVCFEIIDSGIGLTEEQLGKIFEPFAQADSSTTRKYGGTGLGLSISQHLIELMGGRLRAESKLDLGSKFGFALTFPLADPPEEPAANLSPARPTFIGRVLVCEDNSINQEVITEHLSGVGLTADIAVNGRQGVEMALAAAGEGRPHDLILMDIHMPEMDGLTAAAELRLRGLTTPVIALTANITSADKARYRESGLADCLGKPFKSKDLWSTLLKHLPPVKSGPARPETTEGAALTPLTNGLRPGDLVNVTQGLDQAAGNPALYERLLNNFLKDYSTREQEIGRAIKGDDLKTAVRLAHTLKGLAGTIGAGRLSEAARAVEEALVDARPERAAALVPELEAALTEILAELAGLARPLDQPAVPVGHGPADAAGMLKLIERLSPLLQSGATESLDLLEDVREVFGPLGERGRELATRIEEYDFDLAYEALMELKGELTQGN